MTAPTTVRIRGGTLRELRVRTGHGLESFAAAAAISRPYLSLLETGRRERVSPEIFTRICLALGVTDRTLLLNPEPEPEPEPEPRVEPVTAPAT